jgi:HEAT repeat protein
MLRRFVRVVVGVVVGVSILVAVIWVLSLSLGMREQEYQGEPILYWQLACLSTNPVERSQAIAVLNAQILPDLTNTMFHDWNDSKIRMRIIDLLNELPGIEIAYVSAPGRRGGAAAALGEFGPPASAAVPALIEALNGSDRAVRRPAAIALGRIHTDPDVVIPALIPYLASPELAQAAVLGLGGFGPAAKPAVPDLLALFYSPDHDVQKAVWYALQGIDPEAFTRAVLEWRTHQDEAAGPGAGSVEDRTNSPSALNPAQ